ncbi:hypothetical protein B0H21DRAFT_741963, partial [Amylocystis lapponica]
ELKGRMAMSRFLRVVHAAESGIDVCVGLLGACGGAETAREGNNGGWEETEAERTACEQAPVVLVVVAQYDCDHTAVLQRKRIVGCSGSGIGACPSLPIRDQAGGAETGLTAPKPE